MIPSLGKEQTGAKTSGSVRSGVFSSETDETHHNDDGGDSVLHAGQWMRIDANRSRPSEHREAQCSNGRSLFESLKRFTMSLFRSLMRHRLPNRFRKDYTGEYRHKRYERQKEAFAREEKQEAAIADYQAPRFFDINALLSDTGERNYLLTLYTQRKGEAMTYLNNLGADKDQIAEIFRRLEEIIKE
jgi:hypothetical protein